MTIHDILMKMIHFKQKGISMKAYTGDQPFIFVSYAHADRETVYPIIELLQNNGYHVWYDEGLHIGNDWRDELADKIQICRAFIFMQSNASVKSAYCKDEIYAADSEMKKRMDDKDTDEDGLPFLTIKLDESDVSGGLRMILNTKQKVNGVNVSAKEIIQQLIGSSKLDACRDQFRYVEGENWGPARSGYYFDECPDHPVFNSVIDSPIYGDERHFLSINDPMHSEEDHFYTVMPGNSYTVEMIYNNDALPNTNGSGKGLAQKVKVSVKLPDKLTANKAEILQAEISSVETEYSSVWDQIALCCPFDAIIEYKPATAKIYNYGKLSGTILSTELFTTGDYIGYNKLSGVVPAGLAFSGRIVFEFRVKPIRQVFFERTVSVDRKNYSDRVSVRPGDILTFRIKMINNHYNDIGYVTFRDELPEGLEYIPDTTILYAIPDVAGRKLVDAIAKNGINTGTFGVGVSGVIQYKARVREDISDSCKLVSKSHLWFNPIKEYKYDSEHHSKPVLEAAVDMHAETSCYVHV